MFKRISCFALSIMLFWGVMAQQVVAAGTVEEPQQLTAEVDTVLPSENQNPEPEGPSLFLNTEVVEQAALIYHRDIAYVSLRAVALALRPDAVITWTGDYAEVKADGLYITVCPDNNYIVANDRCLYAPEGVLYEDGIIRVPARVIAKAFDASFSYNTITKDIYLTSGSGAITPADEFYDKDDLYWLSHIIYAESGNQSLIGKIAVGNVVMNRAADPVFPNSIYGVVFQKNQFTPVRNGTIHLTPNKESIVAAKLCLDGAVVLPTALWFNSARANSWAAKHKVYITTIGAHAFYV